jgi:tetratricopeptide (TPR) repeat protein
MKNIFITIAFVFSLIINAQNVEFKKKNFEDQEGFKVAFQAVKDGDKKFFEGDYSQALVFYKDAYKFNPDNAKLNFKMGVAYLKSEESEKSLDYFLKAKELDPQVDPKLNFALAQAYQANKQYKTAINTYKGYLANLEESEKPSVEPKVQGKIKECELAGGMDAVTEVKETPVLKVKEPIKEIAEEKIEPATIEIKEEVKKEEIKPVEPEKETIEVVAKPTVVKEEPTKLVDIVAEPKVIKEEPKSTTKAVEVAKTKSEVEKSINSNSIVYKIQLTATSRDLTQSEIKKLYSGTRKVEKDTVNGINKYLVGTFSTKQDAQAFIKNIKVKDAFIVKYKDGKRIY